MKRYSWGSATFARVVVVIVLLTASGCSALGGSADSNGDLPAEQEAADRYATLDGVRATVTTVQRRNNATTRQVSLKRERVGSFAYYERILSVNRTDDARPPLVAEGGFVIANGSTLVFYDPASERLQRISFARGNNSRRSTIPKLVAAAREDEPVSQPVLTPGISPLPTVPRDESTENGTTPYRDGNVTVTYNGTDRVDGREAYRLEVTPVSEGMGLRSQTLWLETQYLFPVKRHTIFVAHGDRYDYTITYRNVTFNPTFAPGTFQLDDDEVPEDAQQVQFENYDSRAALAEAVALPIPEPDVPPAYELDSASYRSSEPELVTLRYTSAGSDTDITIGIFAEARNVTGTDSVQVETYEATRSRRNGTTTIAWVAGNNTYYVSGGDNATLLRVARSVAETA